MPHLLQTYRIETPRVCIRCYQPDDAEAMSAVILRNSAHLLPWLPWAEEGRHTPEFCRGLLRTFRGQYDLGTDFPMGIWRREDGRYIGGTGLHPRVGEGALEIGYWLDEAVTGQGYATHVAAALTKVCFDYEGLVRVNIHMQVENGASERVPLRLGYKRDGLLRQRIPLGDGRHGDIHYFSMLREDYDASGIAAMELHAFGFAGERLSGRGSEAAQVAL